MKKIYIYKIKIKQTKSLKVTNKFLCSLRKYHSFDCSITYDNHEFSQHLHCNEIDIISCNQPEDKENHYIQEGQEDDDKVEEVSLKKKKNSNLNCKKLETILSCILIKLYGKKCCDHY